MDRRSLLKLLPVAVTGLALGSTVTAASEGNRIAWHSYSRSHREELRAVTNKIIKESARMWMASVRYRESERGAVLVTIYGNLARKITFDSGQINQEEITLDEKQRAELQQYKNELGRCLPQRIGSQIGVNGDWRLRAWIYNGRHPNEWIMSADKIAA